MAPQNDSISLQDGFGIVLIASFCLASFWHRFRFRFGAVLGAQLDPAGGKVELGVSDLWGVQDGAGVVLVRFFFRLAVWGRIFDPLGRSWDRLKVLLGCFRVLLGLLGFSWGRVMTEWQPFSSSLLRFWVLLGPLKVLLGLCWSKMGPFFHLPWFPPALFRSSHQPCAFMALHVS